MVGFFGLETSMVTNAFICSNSNGYSGGVLRRRWRRRRNRPEQRRLCAVRKSIGAGTGTKIIFYISMTFMPLRSNNYSNEPQGLPTHLSALVQTDFLEAHYESDGAEVQTDQTDRSPEVQGQATTRCYSAAVPNSSTPALHTYKLVGEGCWRAERCRRTQLWQSGERWSQPWSESQPRER